MVIRTIKTSDEFEDEFNEITDNLFLLSTSINNDFQKLFIQKMQNIRIFPEMYPKLLQKPIYRKVLIKNYILLYMVNNDEIILSKIIHQKSKYFNNQD